MVTKKKSSDRPVADILALTPLQEGILFHYLTDPGSDLYRVQLVVEIGGTIDFTVFRQAWNVVIAANDMLRAGFRWRRVKNPMAVILKEHLINPEFHDLAERSKAEKAALLSDILERQQQAEFDLQDVPFRVTLVKLERERYRLVISHHHILYDGWSQAVILKEFFTAYAEISEGGPVQRRDKTPYKSYLKWLKNRSREQEKVFWQEYLGSADIQTELSIKRKAGEGSDCTGNQPNRISPARWTEFDRFCRKHRITLAAFLYTGWGLLLQQYNNSDDAVFGTTVSGRTADIEGIESIVGLFINTIPLRVKTDGGDSAAVLLKRIDEEMRVRREYETTSLVQVGEYSGFPAGEHRFDTLVVLENYPLDPKTIAAEGKLSVRSYSVGEMTHYDLTLSIRMFHRIEMDVAFNRSVLSPSAIARLTVHYRRILEEMCRCPHQKVSSLEMMTLAERQDVLFHFNDTERAFPPPVSPYRLFEDRVRKIPHRLALKGRGDKSGILSFTYEGLQRLAVLMGERLQQRGLKPGEIVGLLIPRMPEMLAAMLGILKTGGTYLPIDPDCPPQRLTYMLRDSAIALVVCDNGERLTAVSGSDSLCRLDLPQRGDWLPPAPASSDSHPVAVLAYVIYTSGSTGRPKGVAVETRGIVNFFEGIADIIPVTETDTVLALTTISFDIFVLESLFPLSRGGAVFIGGPEEQLKAAAAAEIITREKISLFQTTPSRLQVFAENRRFGDCLARLKYLLVGGESFEPPLLSLVRKLTRAKVFNMYGPTETTVWSTVKAIVPGEELTIGKPIANTRIYIFNETGGLQPAGLPGELCIAGTGLAPGYLNKPELTAEKFILHGSRVSAALFDSHNPVLYKTGDLACWREEGDIEYIGRIDHQVKVRGYRIELGEIEAQLRQHPDIDKAVVCVHRDRPGDTCLTAFVVARPTIPVPSLPAVLREYLSRRIPGYMIPGRFVPLDSIPLTAAGKADRRALAAGHQGLPTTQLPTVVPPRSREESIVADIWRKVLNIDHPGLDERLFDVGGNSLAAIRINARLEEAFKMDIPITAMFRYPSVRSLAEYIRRLDSGRPGREDSNDGNKEVKAARKRTGRRSGIAVIGMAGRFPGARNLTEFWNNLITGVESVRQFSHEELAAAGVADELIRNPRYVKAKGILENIEYFDALFFGYNARETALMDPQLRLLHECAWEALEDAGYDPRSYEGDVGLYAGALPGTRWLELLSRIPGTHSEFLDLASLTDRDFFCTRLAYNLNLRGPAVTIQTACSTSLVAVDAACSALLVGKCDMAVAGGVSISLEDQTGYLYEEGMVRSPDGRCRAFSADAAGTAAGNGGGLVVLRPLTEADAQGDHIYAVIKGSAVNNDGSRKVGYTAPSIEGQAEVIRAALREAGVKPESIGYLEAHGTGTELGDPVEIEGLTAAFDTDKRGYCGIGSVKTNLGHLDAAAGIAGLIKSILALRHKVIPPSLHFKSSNPDIDFERTPFFVVSELREWPAGKYPRRAGISSFGIGGTNAHVILEEAPGRTINRKRTAAGKGEGHCQLILLSAVGETALNRMSRNLAAYFEDHPGISLADAAYTLQLGRRELRCRGMLVCDDLDKAAAQLSGRASDRLHTFTVEGIETAAVFMFPGQGSQYAGMGRDLYRREPVFRRELDRCIGYLLEWLEADIAGILYPPLQQQSPVNTGESVDQTGIAQPLLFAFEFALARLLIHRGIRPAAMIGHSIGEYTAACLSGVFSLKDAARVVALRAKLMQSLPRGVMYRVNLQPETLTPLLLKNVSLAAVNTPELCVVSGPPEAVTRQVELLTGRGHECGRLHTSHAFHSAIMESIAVEFEAHLKEIILNRPGIPYISNLSGSWITPTEATDPAYWSAHLCRPVLFSTGLGHLLSNKETVFFEVGPGRSLSTFVNKHPGKQTFHRVINLVRHPREPGPDDRFLLEQTGRWWLYGGKVDWSRIHEPGKRCRISLPTYPFDRQPYWPEGEAGPGIDTDPVSRWFYRPRWKEQPPPQEETALPENVTWLVFLDGWGESLLERLKGEQRRVICIRPGNCYAPAGDGSFTVDPANPAHYDAVLADSDFSGGRKIPLKIVHLWSVSPRPTAPLDPEAVEHALNLGFYSLLNLARAVGSQDRFGSVQIYVVSNNMQPVTGQDLLCPLQSTLLGAIQVVPQEFPRISMCSIDLDMAGPDTNDGSCCLEGLWAELGTASSDRQVAYRQGRRHILAYSPVRLSRADLPVLPLKQEGVYLITGGLGGIGLKLADYLARTIQARLALIVSTPFPERSEWSAWAADSGRPTGIRQKITALREMECAGAEVMVFSADVAELLLMQPVVNQVRDRFGSIDGVIHCAGRADGRLVPGIDREYAERILAPKTRGLLVLDSLFENHPPDFFVFFSSINVAVPTPGQACYTAANAFMDAFALYKKNNRRSRFISIDWDAWKEVGMAVTAEPGGEDRLIRIDHPLLQGYRQRRAEERVYVFRLNSHNCWFLDEHRFQGQPMLPATGALEMVRAVFVHYTGQSSMEMREVYFTSPLVAADPEEREVNIIFKRRGSVYEFILTSRSGEANDGWQEHARGIAAIPATQEPKIFDIGHLFACCREREIYFVDGGYKPPAASITFGPRWANIDWIRQGDKQALALLRLPEEFSGDLALYKLHPAMLDNAAIFCLEGTTHPPGTEYAPFGYQQLTIKEDFPGQIISRVSWQEAEPFHREVQLLDISLMDEQGRELADIRGFTLKKIGQPALSPAFSREDNDCLTIASPGDIKTLEFRPAPRLLPGKGEVEIEILATGLNFKEILYSLGMLPAPGDTGTAFGMECAGQITAVGPGVEDFEVGEAVIAYGGSLFSRYKTVAATRLARKPAHLGFAEAAGIPLAFMTAYHSLVRLAGLNPGEKVLIHSAAGGVGLAAVRISRWRGAEILATAGNPEKREYLRSLGIECVMDSRSLDFTTEVMTYTGGKGVDVLLNSLSGEFITAGLSVMAPYGRFVEIGIRDINQDRQLGLNPFARSLSFFAVNISEELPDFTELFRRVVRHLAKGDFNPLPFRLFRREEIVEAFQYMARARHIGKIVVGRSEGLAVPADQRLTEIRHKNIENGIAPADGVEAFRRILAAEAIGDSKDMPRLVVSPGGLEKRLKGVEIVDFLPPQTEEPGKRRISAVNQRPPLTTAYAAPSGEMERTLAGIWEAYLGIDKVGINDNFFELGASSLDMIQIGGRLNEAIHMEIPAVKLFNYPTIRLLAGYVAGKGNGEGVHENDEPAEAAAVEGKERLKAQRKGRL